MAPVTSPPCAGGPALLDIQMTVTTDHKETPEAGPTGLIVISTQADCPAKAGSLTKALATVPTVASATAKTLPSSTAKEVREDPHTVDIDAPPHTGTIIKLVTSSHPPPLPDE